MPALRSVRPAPARLHEGTSTVHSQKGATALSIACSAGHTGCVRLLIEAGARIDAKDAVRVCSQPG